ncbi:N-acetylglutamate synthase-like GNAT family acetyltransferase [Rhizobium sp. BK529]|uniref:GNAT family N-acetyltransferase n=1 Tax=Rhizobium sp. BK529 TaxID=2586983 RepID=UPI00161BE2A8|nr:GNAT family N-acetyltransferase [Rhizobium sp. BK529]MBB3593005.1 N-acetylglutamate synthase-like GNAT family acetyltransferase [Rhizobium sp. BK529]
MTPFRIDGSFARWSELLHLIRASFAYMDGRIDPPSSAIRLTVESLTEKAKAEIAYAVENDGWLTGCMFLRPEADCLYIGKLAVLPSAQGKGIGRRLLDIAEETARDLDLPALRLETRVELVDNHSTFSAWGFARTAEKSHPGFTRTTFVEMRKTLTG